MAKRRTWGTIKTMARDKHVLRYNADGARRSVTFYGTRREAEAELAKLRTLYERKSPRRVPTVGQAAEAWWLPWLESRHDDGEMSDNTFNSYRRAWDKHAAPRWADVRLDQVKASEVQAWLDGMAHGNAHHSIVVLRKIGDMALKHDAVGVNAFAAGYDLPKKTSTRSKAVYTLDQADALFERLHGHVVEAPFIAACFGSCRKGEALGITTADVRRIEVDGLTLAVAKIERQMGQSGYTPAKTLKTDKSRRIVIIPEKWGERFLEIADERRAVGSEWMADRCDGLPLSGGALNRHWESAVEDAERIPFANLRNSWRTFAQAEWRIDYDLLETLMGHELEGVTGRHYLRFTESQIIEQFAREFALGCAS